MTTPDTGTLPGTALETVGRVFDEDHGKDAVHIAAIAVEAGERLFPGQHVGLVDGLASSKTETTIGIVDPFITGSVRAGKWFWLMLYPRTITSLRHEWTHPAFPDAGAVEKPGKSAAEESEAWLRGFCDSGDLPGYDTVMKNVQMWEGADDKSPWESSLFISGMDANGDIPDEFWDHVENVLGRSITSRPTHFSCSC